MTHPSDDAHVARCTSKACGVARCAQAKRLHTYVEMRILLQGHAANRGYTPADLVNIMTICHAVGEEMLSAWPTRNAR